ncbi:hypothetical protein ACFQV4_25390 [Streptomyces thermocarboxydus]
MLGAALLAAAVTGALALRRTLQRRRRKPGEKIAIVSETSAAEAQLAAAAEPGGAARLDVALRTLAHHVAQQRDDAALPPLRAARIGTRMVEVLPEDLTQDPVAPFTSGHDGWWALPTDAALLDDEAARDVPAPYPGLVTIGSTEEGDLLLLNLAQLPALLLDGNPVHITEVCTSLALELGMSPWAADVEVVTVGFGEDLPQLLPTTRIAHMRQATHALRDLSERLLEAHQMPETRHQPYLLLCASSLDEDTAWQFADVIDKAGPVPVTLIAPASTAAARFPRRQSSTPPQRPADPRLRRTDITVQRLEHAAYLQITTALNVSGQPPHPAEGPWQHVPDEPENMQQPKHTPPEHSIAPATASIPAPAEAPDERRGLPGPARRQHRPVWPPPPLPATPSAGLHDATGPGAEAAEPSVPAPPADDGPTGTATTAVSDDPETAVEKLAPPDTQESQAQDPHALEIRVLGPVEVTGVDSTGHGPRMAQLAALLYFRPGGPRMSCVPTWTPSALVDEHPQRADAGPAQLPGQRLLRQPLRPAPQGREDLYRLAPTVRCD